MKYFDKDFFKFSLGFLTIISLSLLIIAAVSAYAGGISQIAFTTAEQTIRPDEISEPLTIQTQDVGGTSLQTSETIDITFESSSATGEFLGGTGKPVQKYMAKNTANKTFYYRDSAEGSFVLTISAKGRDSGLEFNTNQSITVSGTSPKTEESTPPPKKEPEPKVEPKKELDKSSISDVATTPPASMNKPVVSEETPKKEEKTPIAKDKKETKQSATVLLSKEESIQTDQTSASSSLVIYETPRNESWWSKLWNFLKNIFS